MKAIRLCMDLQNTNKNKEAKALEMSASSSSVRTGDDMEIDSSSTASSSRGSDSGRPEKKELIRNKRRHYSDVNPGNIGKMFSIKGLTLDNSKPVSQSVSSADAVEQEIRPEMSLPSHMDLATGPKTVKYDVTSWSGGGGNIPFRRFVEGSDSNTTSPASSIDLTAKSTADKLAEEERRQRAKSPSTKVKEKKRSKSPKLHSPPPEPETTGKFSYITGSSLEEDKMSVSSSEEIPYMDDHDVCTVSSLALVRFCLVNHLLLLFGA